MSDSPDSVIVSDRWRSPIVVQKRLEGGVIIRGPRSLVMLSPTEIERFVEFVDDTPQLGELARFPVTK